MDAFEANLYTFSFNLFFFGFAVIILITAWYFLVKRVPKLVKKLHLNRHADNPVISPTPGSGWDEVGTFNPAAVTDKDGNVHIIYRSIGADGVSRFGYAVSPDGTNFDDKLPYPVFAMVNPRMNWTREKQRELQKFDPIMYPSGGSWGGAEDPRMVNIDGKIYVSFSAFDGWDFIRMAVISISEKDFFARKWKWSKPMLISPQGEVHKNWVLFPEKINGKFAILHSINPEVQIDYVDSLKQLESGEIKIKSKFGGGKKKREAWDTWIRGAGPPPLRTDKGWLVLYHAIEEGDNTRYKLGALLLDINDPTKVIARAPAPLLFSNEWYENDWKPGVVYACGAVVKNDCLHVYYGGGDKHVCVAHTPLNDLLNWLMEHGHV